MFHYNITGYTFLKTPSAYSNVFQRWINAFGTIAAPFLWFSIINFTVLCIIRRLSDVGCVWKGILRVKDELVLNYIYATKIYCTEAIKRSFVGWDFFESTSKVSNKLMKYSMLANACIDFVSHVELLNSGFTYSCLFFIT